MRAVTATMHEPGWSPSHRVVSYGSAMEVLGFRGETVSLPACMQRSICRGAAPASRCDALILNGDRRALFFAVLNGTSIPDPVTVSCSCDPDNWAYGRCTPRDIRERHHLRSHQLFPSRCNFSIARSAFQMRGARLLQPAAAAKHCFSLCSTEHPFQVQNLSIFRAIERTGFADEALPSRPQKITSPLPSVPLLVLQLHRYLDALGDDSSFFTVTQQQWRACIRGMLRCKLAYKMPPSSLDPRLASGAFAVAKDEGRDGFIGYRCPLNGGERSIGRAGLLYCPRLRRKILGRSETVQITFRDTLQRTVVQYLDVSAEVDKNVFQERIF